MQHHLNELTTDQYRVRPISLQEDQPLHTCAPVQCTIKPQDNSHRLRSAVLAACSPLRAAAAARDFLRACDAQNQNNSVALVLAAVWAVYSCCWNSYCTPLKLGPISFSCFGDVVTDWGLGDCLADTDHNSSVIAASNTMTDAAPPSGSVPHPNGSNDQTRHQLKLIEIIKTIQAHNLSFQQFVVGVIRSSNPTVRLTTTKWLRSHTHLSSYGPSTLVNEVWDAVESRADEEQRKSFVDTMAERSQDVYVREVAKAASSQWLRVPHTADLSDETSEQALTGNLRDIQSFYNDTMPRTMTLLAHMSDLRSSYDTSGAVKNAITPQQRQEVAKRKEELK
ncbi:unnamed protein product [Tilletia caries]|uniref:Uncharacterized protein n=2 Tax=Tilletia caries TaxID=13290 RepID=A0ABN7J9N0_9BASI|nr:unnamed protein product [Tilletia caries]